MLQFFKVKTELKSKHAHLTLASAALGKRSLFSEEVVKNSSILFTVFFYVSYAIAPLRTDFNNILFDRFEGGCNLFRKKSTKMALNFTIASDTASFK